MINVTDKDGAIYFNVKIVPRASRSEIAGELGGALKVRISSPPVDGAANAELVKLLAENFGASKSDVEIVSGQTSKLKHIKISNLARGKFLRLLQAAF